MADKRTVFIVGAGASSELGLPVGRGLLEQISRTVTVTSGERGPEIRMPDRVLSALLHVIATNGRFSVAQERYITAIALWIAQNAPLAPSIDNLLHAHESDAHIKACGKILIAHCISAAEKASKLAEVTNTSGHFSKWDSHSSDHWLGRVFWLLAEGSSFDEFKRRLSQIDFITFNYDRCIEFFLLNAAASYFRLTSDQLGELKNSLTVLHTYGHLGDLGIAGEQMTGFGEIGQIHEIASSISTFTDGMNDEAGLQAMRLSLSKADQIFFLGFGFLALNMDLLFSDFVCELKPKIYGTAFRLSSNSRLLLDHSIRARVRQGVNRAHPGVTIGNDSITVELQELGCKELMDHYHFLLRT